MKQFDKKIRQIAADGKIKMPSHVKNRMETTLASLPKIEKRPWIFGFLSRTAFAAASIAFALIFIMPNVSTVYAKSMEHVPVLGELIRVVTIRNYFYSDENHELDIDVPQISDFATGDAAKRINADVDELTRDLMTQFYQELEGVGRDGHGSVQVDYKVIQNTERWFTLKLSVNMIAASGNSYFKYYHVDKQTGEIIKLSDLFTDSDFGQIIAENIKDQMRKQMEEDSNLSYFATDAEFGHDFAHVSDDHNFYFNEQGDLVIPFDKYEVAPGFMGCPEFVVDKAVIQGILKSEFQNIG